jgi:hypothetical protein
VIIAYNIDTADANGRVVGGVGQILALSVLPAGLPDGKSLYAMGNYPVDPNFQRGNRAINTGARSAVRATLSGRLCQPLSLPTGISLAPMSAKLLRGSVSSYRLSKKSGIWQKPGHGTSLTLSLRLLDKCHGNHSLMAKTLTCTLFVT